MHSVAPEYSIIWTGNKGYPWMREWKHLYEIVNEGMEDEEGRVETKGSAKDDTTPYF